MSDFIDKHIEKAAPYMVLVGVLLIIHAFFKEFC